jgi:hypothetical protein
MTAGFGNSHGMPVAEAMQGVTPISHRARPFSSRSSDSVWPDRVLHRAVSRSNHAARSTSGKAAIRPLAGGHSISKELLTSDAVSKPASPRKAITRLPRAGGSLPRLATGRWRPPDPVLRRTRGGRPAPDPLTHRSRLSELTRHHRPSCVSMAQRDERAALPDHTAPAIGQYARAQIGSRASSLGDRHRRLAGEILTQLGILRGAR